MLKVFAIPQGHWDLVFRHDARRNEYFQPGELEEMNPLNSGSRLFSILGSLTDEDRTPLGDFHFRMVYPEGFMEWVQTSNPFNSSMIEGFTSFQSHFGSFNGKSQHTRPACKK